MLPLLLRDVVSFFVAFEKELYRISPPGVMEPQIRDPEKLIEQFKAYSNCEFSLEEWDFSTPSEREEFSLHAEKETPEAIWSLIVNYGDRATIVVNDMKRANKERLVNTCYRRFLAIKEAYHVILRDEFARKGLEHPNNDTPERLATALEELTYLTFTMIDFDSADYPDSTKIENAAELFSMLTLYPLDDLAADRDRFRGNGPAGAGGRIIASSTMDFAKERLVPQHYVDVLWRWNKFDLLYSMYKQLKDDRSIR